MTSTIYDITTVIRSKNAGPFTLTIDMIFASDEDMQRVLDAPELSPEAVGELYGVEPRDVTIHAHRAACAVKVSMPRRISSGSAADRDVYGSQQHMLLASVQTKER